MKQWLFAVLIAVSLGVVLPSASSVSALNLTVSPLRYDDTLAKREKKKGFIDFTNTGPGRETIEFSVERFRQTDNKGNIEFEHDARVAEGIKLDLDSVVLDSGEAIHLAFELDGTKLPSGDVFAAIFATTKPSEEAAVAQAVRVGTLLFITNGTPQARTAAIEHATAPFLQVGESVSLTFDVRNTADPKVTTGFAPPLTIALWPFGEQQTKGPFVMSGGSRGVTYVKKGDYIGLMFVTVTTGESVVRLPLIAITGYWRYVVIVILMVAVVLLYMRRKKRGPRPSKLAKNKA